MGSQQQYKRAKISKEDIKEAKSLVADTGINLFTHLPVIYNLAGSSSKGSLAWSGNPEVDNQMTVIAENITGELKVMNQVCGCGCVVHPGFYICGKKEDPTRPKALAMEAIAKTINLIKFDGPTKLLLENSANENGKTCASIEDLSQVRSMCNFPDQIGYCIDTAHGFGSGLYNFSKKDQIDALFHQFDKYGYPSLFHVNDSEVPFGSRKDRHQRLGDGYIWKESTEGLIYLAQKCAQYRIPMIAETDNSVVDAHLLISLTSG
jgi:deoxyribonuclease-4